MDDKEFMARHIISKPMERWNLAGRVVMDWCGFMSGISNAILNKGGKKKDPQLINLNFS
ncbi:MAG: hypothetical protein ACK52W_09210 [Alphaproteobacteria bacterium]